MGGEKQAPQPGRDNVSRRETTTYLVNIITFSGPSLNLRGAEQGGVWGQVLEAEFTR